MLGFVWKLESRLGIWDLMRPPSFRAIFLLLMSLRLSYLGRLKVTTGLRGFWWSQWSKTGSSTDSAGARERHGGRSLQDPFLQAWCRKKKGLICRDLMIPRTNNVCLHKVSICRANTPMDLYKLISEPQFRALYSLMWKKSLYKLSEER